MKSASVRLGRLAPALAMAAFATAVHAQPTPALTPDLQEIARTGQIVIGVREQAAPFAFVDERGPRGYSVDICTRIAEELRRVLNRPDLRIRYNTLIVSQRTLLVREKVVDLECGNTSVTEERRRDFDFTQPYGVEQSYLVSRTSAPVVSLDQLGGDQKILVTGGTTSEDWLRQDSGRAGQIEPVRNASRAYFALVDGKALAYVGSVQVFLGTVLQRGGNTSNFQGVLIAGDDVEPLAAMLRKGRPGLKQVADQTIRGMAASGELDTLYRKWFEGSFAAGGGAMNVPMSDLWRSVVYPNP